MGPVVPRHQIMPLWLPGDVIQWHVEMLHEATKQRVDHSSCPLRDLERDSSAFCAIPPTSPHTSVLLTLNDIDDGWSHVNPFSATLVEGLPVFHQHAFCQLQPPSSVDSGSGNRDGQTAFDSACDSIKPEVDQQQQQQSPSTLPSARFQSLLQAICLDSVASHPTANPSSTSLTHLDQAKSSKLKHVCTHEGCGKSFRNGFLLKMHTYSHTGEKPYNCSVCGQSFSQAGNCRTHERRHYGERPKRKRDSDPYKSYECLLDDCRVRTNGSDNHLSAQGKIFKKLGNLQKHMERFHKESLARLASPSVPLSTEDKELKMHICSLFKNTNKGIKGRGKGRKVDIVQDFSA